MHTSGLGHLCKLCGCRRISSLRCVLHSIITPELSSWTVSQPGCRINLAALTSVWGCQEPLASCTKDLADLQFHTTVPGHCAFVPAGGMARDGPRPPCASTGEAAHHSLGCRQCLSVCRLVQLSACQGQQRQDQLLPNHLAIQAGDCSAVACEHHLEMHTIRTSISVCFALTESWTDTLQKHFLP